MAVLRFVAAWLAALVVLLLRLSCRARFHADPRPALQSARKPYAYAILHGHQLAAVLAAEPGTGAMVSRSVDGDLLVPSLLVSRVVVVRGSSRDRGRDKGGKEALDKLIRHVQNGRPAYRAVDGPRGPRGTVSRGIARLALETGAAVVTAVPVARRRYVFARAWDRFQVPKPFTRVDFYFGAPIEAAPGEDLETLRLRIERALAALEAEHDPIEAALGQEAAAKRREKLAREAAAKEAGAPTAAPPARLDSTRG
ncbi:MAG: DUF374 domain-containing protein [Deltaproteobacteria bacterium]|nr:DUF374 domain-containing protein [Deltaproteobacteria bacterium]